MNSDNKTAMTVDPLMRPNHLTAVRWVLASMVALSHLWVLTTGDDPLQIYNWPGAWIAVNGFFILSGLLIAKSLFSRRDVKAYTKSRLLRIYPALIVIMLAYAFVFAPFFSRPGGIERIFAPETWHYVLRVLLMGDPETAPAGIFAGSSEEVFNGPLWTIRFEMIAYFLAGLTFITGIARGFKSTLLLYVLCQAAYLVYPFINYEAILPFNPGPLLRLGSAFTMGMVLWHWPAARRPAWWIVILCLAIFLFIGRTSFAELFGNLAMAGIIMRLGLSDRTYKLFLKLPDYSYGIYIWHFPVMQIFMFLNPAIGPWELALYSVPLFLLLAGLSWHLIEKPALSLKRRIKQDPRIQLSNK